MDRMREEFEYWCASIGFTLKPNAFDNGDYAMGYGWQEWNAWKASRAALCVELPKTPGFSASDEPDLAYEEGIDDMKDILESMGVTCK